MPNVLFTSEIFEEAKHRLSRSFGNFEALVAIGGYHFELGITDFSKWSEALNDTVRAELGRPVRSPMLEEIYVGMRGKAFDVAQALVRSSVTQRPNVGESLNRFLKIERSSIPTTSNSGTTRGEFESTNPTTQSEPQEKSAASKSLSTIIGKDRADELERLLDELNSLIGLDRLKADIIELTNYVIVSQERKSRGLKVSDSSLHMVFIGNPGTGKTTVARLVSQIYKALGVISKGHLIEASRSDLVGGYLGQTALKTKGKVEEALGGTLFIDEAYSLAPESSGSDSFGQEALDTLVKLMEDNRSDLVVIVAGYPAEMQRFLAANSGLQSRFNKFLSFDDYNSSELVRIFEHFCSQADYRLAANARGKLSKLFDTACLNRDISRFGNAREARNVFDQTIKNLASRVVTLASLQDHALMTIEEADVPDVWPTTSAGHALARPF
jgi:SpoVK/Ycf46/Vps4 family AAA+-type ATPase